MSKLVNQENLASFAKQFSDSFKDEIGTVVEEAIEGTITDSFSQYVKKGDSITLPNGKNFIAGEEGSSIWSGLHTRRLLGDIQYESRMGVGSFFGSGYAQIALHNLTNGGEMVNRLLLNKDSFIPNTNGSTDLGSETYMYRKAYFKDSVYAGNGSRILADSINEYCTLGFYNNLNNKRYGTIGKEDPSTEDIVVKSEAGDLYLISPYDNHTIIGRKDAYIYTHFGDKAWRLAPKSSISGLVDLGHDAERWNTLFSVKPPNVASDKSLKENIVYVEDISTINSETITKQDAYSFVKDVVKIAEYNYINKDENGNKVESTQYERSIGFIANDIQGNKVGEKILTTGEDGILGYNTQSYNGTLTLALQKAIEKIEALEMKILELTNFNNKE